MSYARIRDGTVFAGLKYVCVCNAEINLRFTEVVNENEHRIDARTEPLIMAVKKELHEKKTRLVVIFVTVSLG